jgi:hypothetical protein
MTSNSALERTAGSHALAAAAHRNVSQQEAGIAVKERCSEDRIGGRRLRDAWGR